MFKRKIYNQLLKWKEESNGKTALLLEGQRRVGKSTIVEEFAKNEYESYILVDFYTASKDVKALFDDLSNLSYIFLQLQLVYKKNLKVRKSLIIFDEVQLCPKARSAIKALVKDGRYDYIETGSLISIRKNSKDILIPSEEKRIKMWPMDYEEFRWALGDEVSCTMLRELYEKKQSLSDEVSRKIFRDYRLYMLVGGMPQAVETYINENNLSMVDEVKRDILSLYKEDFRKIDPTGRISSLFDAIPSRLMNNSGRYNVSSVLSSSRALDVLEEIEMMKDSGTVLVSYHANDPNAWMAQTKDLTRFKLFLADTGLFVTLAFMDKKNTDNEIYSKLLSDKLSVNLGYVYENVVAQTFMTNGYELYYHTFNKKDSKHKYEIDFLLPKENKICPIEVKSSGYNTHSSIDAFSSRFSQRVGRKIVIYTKTYRKDKDIELLPFYMAQFL